MSKLSTSTTQTPFSSNPWRIAAMQNSSGHIILSYNTTQNNMPKHHWMDNKASTALKDLLTKEYNMDYQHHTSIDRTQQKEPFKRLKTTSSLGYAQPTLISHSNYRINCFHRKR
jgi:hypothetical protein